MKLFLIITLLVGITLSNGFSFSRDFNFQIPGLQNGPSFGGSVNANAGQSDALTSAFSGAVNSTFANIRQNVENFIEQSLLQISKPIRDRLGITDDTVKSFVSNLSNVQKLFSSFQQPQLPGLPNLGQLPRLSLPQFGQLPNLGGGLPQFGQLPNLGGGLPQLTNPFSAPQNLPGLPNLSQLPGLKELSQIGNALNPENFKNLFSNFNLLNGGLSNNGIQQALSSFANTTKAGGDVVKKLVLQFNQAFNASTAAYKSSITSAADAAKSDIQKSLSSLSSTVRSCVEKNGNPGTKAIDTARQSAFKCIDDKVQEGLSIVNNARNDIDTGVAGVQNFTQGLSQCQLNVSLTLTNLPVVSASRASCLASSLLNIQGEAFIAPFNLASRGFQAYAFYQSLQGYAIQCVGKLFSQVAVETSKTTIAISKCSIDQSVNNNTG